MPATPFGPEPDDNAGEVQALKDEVAQLKQAVDSHAAVDQAIGIVLAVGQLTPEEAWDVLREISMRTNTKLRDVADQIVRWGQAGELAAVLQGELERQLTLRSRDRTDVSRDRIDVSPGRTDVVAEQATPAEEIAPPSSP